MQQFRLTSQIYMALFLGQLLFAGIVFWMITGKTADASENYRSFSFDRLPLMIALTGLTGALLMNKLRTAQGALLSDIPLILRHYHTTVLLRSAILEGCNLIVLTLALINGNLYYLGYFAVGMVGFLYFRPTPDSLSREYGLTQGQEQELKRIVTKA